ncbi:MAG: hypothetical protein EOO47_20895, partial [Flavobacterium sp.]
MIYKIFRHLLSFFIIFIIVASATAAAKSKNDLPFKVQYFKDKSNKLVINEVVSQKFSNYNKDILNFGVEDATVWIKLTSEQQQVFKQQLIFIEQPRFVIYEMYDQKHIKISSPKAAFKLQKDTLKKDLQNIAFTLPDTVKKGESFYLKLKAHEAFITKIVVLEEKELDEKNSLKDIIFGIYTGIMLVMFVYNLFLFIIVKDKSYIYYVVYILFTWLTQISIQGFGLRYMWSADDPINHYSVVTFSLIGLIFATLFSVSFLSTKIFVPKIHRVVITFILIIPLNSITLFTVGTYASFIIMQLFTMFGVVIALTTSYIVYFKKHFKPAGFYLIAWSILLVGAVLFILKDYGVLPYNTFTTYLLQISSAIEVVLLSFALADKINYFKKENETAQAQALNASLENQKLVKEQNIVLERKVKERTEELENANGT